MDAVAKGRGEEFKIRQRRPMGSGGGEGGGVTAVGGGAGAVGGGVMAAGGIMAAVRWRAVVRGALYGLRGLHGSLVTHGPRSWELRGLYPHQGAAGLCLGQARPGEA